MSIAAPSRQMTAEEFLRWPDNGGKELIHGQIVEMSEMGATAQYISGMAFRLLMQWCRSGRHGWVFPNDLGIQCFPDDTRSEFASWMCASCVRAASPATTFPEGWITLPPGLTVEVVSP